MLAQGLEERNQVTISYFTFGVQKELVYCPMSIASLLWLSWADRSTARRLNLLTTGNLSAFHKRCCIGIKYLWISHVAQHRAADLQAEAVPPGCHCAGVPSCVLVAADSHICCFERGDQLGFQAPSEELCRTGFRPFFNQPFPRRSDAPSKPPPHTGVLHTAWIMCCEQKEGF